MRDVEWILRTVAVDSVLRLKLTLSIVVILRKCSENNESFGQRLTRCLREGRKQDSQWGHSSCQNYDARNMAQQVRVLDGETGTPFRTAFLPRDQHRDVSIYNDEKLPRCPLFERMTTMRSSSLAEAVRHASNGTSEPMHQALAEWPPRFSS